MSGGTSSGSYADLRENEKFAKLIGTVERDPATIPRKVSEKGTPFLNRMEQRDARMRLKQDLKREKADRVVEKSRRREEREKEVQERVEEQEKADSVASMKFLARAKGELPKEDFDALTLLLGDLEKNKDDVEALRELQANSKAIFKAQNDLFAEFVRVILRLPKAVSDKWFDGGALPSFFSANPSAVKTTAKAVGKFSKAKGKDT